MPRGRLTSGILFGLSLLLSATAHAGEAFESGVAVVDITAPLGYRMCGYFSERLNTGVHDPLLAKAIVFRQGDERAALVFCDLCGVWPGVTGKARELAEAKTGIPAENILIAATHSHTGPLFYGALREQFHRTAVERHGEDPQEQIDYPAQLVERLVQAIAEAQAAAQPVELAAAVAEQPGLSFNRRFHMRDGTVRFNPGKLNPDIVRVAGPIDPDVGIVAIQPAGSDTPLAALTVFAMHLDTVGGSEYSGDYPYYLEQALRRDLGTEFVSLFGTGTCGDINHVDVSHDRPQHGHDESQRIGETLAKTVAAELPRLEPIAAPSLAIESRVIDVPKQEYDFNEVEQARRDIVKVGGPELPFLEQVRICKLIDLELRGGSTLPLEVQVFRLSDELAIVGLPGEVFVELGIAIKDASPFKHTLVIELANDDPAYIPTKKAFTEGSYETVNSYIQPGGGEALVEAAVELLGKLAPVAR